MDADPGILDAIFGFWLDIWRALKNPSINGAVLAVVAVAGLTGGLLLWFFGFFKRAVPPGPSITGPTVVMPLADHDKREANYRTELERLHQQISALQTEASGDQLVVLQAEKAEIETRLSDVTAALGARDQLITSLEADLTRAANEYPEVAAKAKAALDGGDFDAADSLFAQMEDAGDLAVLATARHAYSRGEIAEERIRWVDAARHYGKAARLDGSFTNLKKAREFSWRNGDYAVALEFGPKLITAAIAEFGENTQEHALALNEHALSVHAAGRFSEAEGLYRQALEIARATIGETHPNYASDLNNLAAVVLAQGRYDEAEGLYRQALDIGRATIGETHPNYATHLNNLAAVVKAQGRYDEAEGLYRQALDIDRATIGETHPDYATRLNNLAAVVQSQGKFAAAEPFYQQAIVILDATLGPDHPTTVTIKANYAAMQAKQG
jgi:tetratricopeptide (TPR) repeat protein